MGWAVLYIAFGVVALWLLGEVLLQYKARLRWRLLAFFGFVGVVLGVLMPSVPVIAVGTAAFATGQTFVTLSFRQGFSTGWAIGGKPGASPRRRGAAPGAEEEPGSEAVLEVSHLEQTAAYQPEPLPDDTGQYGVYDRNAEGDPEQREGDAGERAAAQVFDPYEQGTPQEQYAAAGYGDRQGAFGWDGGGHQGTGHTGEQGYGGYGEQDYGGGQDYAAAQGYGGGYGGEQGGYQQPYQDGIEHGYAGGEYGEQYAAYSDPYIGGTSAAQQQSYDPYAPYGYPQEAPGGSAAPGSWESDPQGAGSWGPDGSSIPPYDPQQAQPYDSGAWDTQGHAQQYPADGGYGYGDRQYAPDPAAYQQTPPGGVWVPHQRDPEADQQYPNQDGSGYDYGHRG